MKSRVVESAVTDILNGGDVRAVVERKALWSNYYKLRDAATKAKAEDDSEKVAALYPKINRQFNALEDSSQEEVASQLNFMNSLADYLKSKGITPSLD